jgi:glycerol-3-phosphate dehydrogenase (NAD(P)+)
MKGTDMASYQTIGVIGAGAWGTALAQSAAQAGRSVKIWAYEAEVVEAINTAHENTVFLPGAPLNPAITASSDPSDLSDSDAFLMVAPAQHARGILTRFAPHIAQGAPVLLCAKGFERESLALMTDVLRETVPHAIPAVLSGPSFAIDVAKGLPTAVTLACEDRDTGEALMEAVGSQTFRPYWSGDLVGAEVGGSVKNVLAIAAGIVEGRGLGKSAHAALIARGFAEMTRLGLALGAKRETLTGLCGLGDLVLTCSSPQSRNMSCGLALGQGQTLESVLGARKAVTEGVATAPAVVALAKTQGVDMPICAAVDAVLAGRISVDDAIQALLNRPFGPETD